MSFIFSSFYCLFIELYLWFLLGYKILLLFFFYKIFDGWTQFFLRWNNKSIIKYEKKTKCFKRWIYFSNWFFVFFLVPFSVVFVYVVFDIIRIKFSVPLSISLALWNWIFTNALGPFVRLMMIMMACNEDNIGHTSITLNIFVRLFN